jgi:hypothetical protein
MSLSDFYSELGEYVYCYTKDGTYKNAYYKGKGVGDRCTHHVKEKGYDINECYIVARNLEKFKKKSPSFLLESWLIWENDPQDNRVSGHYKECFIMQNFNFLRDEFDASQRDLYTETEEIRKRFPDELSSTNLGRIETKGSISRIETPWKSSLQFQIVIKTSSDKYLCQILTNGTAEKFAPKVEMFSKSFPDVSADFSTTSITWNVDTIEDAIDCWKMFNAAI